jgi:predicted dinucleotide-binding enzyme
MNKEPKIAIIGKGHVGSSLGICFTRAGLHVKFGVQEGSDAKEVLARCYGRAEAMSVADAAHSADVIFLAIPALAVPDVIKTLGNMSGKTVVDCTNTIKWENGPVWNPPDEGSVAELIAKSLKGAKVVKGFNTFGAEFMMEPIVENVPVDLFLAGDDDAKRLVSEIADKAGFKSIDTGSIRNAAALENLGVLWIYFATTGNKGRRRFFKLLERPK